MEAKAYTFHINKSERLIYIRWKKLIFKKIYLGVILYN